MIEVVKENRRGKDRRFRNPECRVRDPDSWDKGRSEKQNNSKDSRHISDCRDPEQPHLNTKFVADRKVLKRIAVASTVTRRDRSYTCFTFRADCD